MTGVDVFMGLLLICGLFIMTLTLLSKQNEQEKKINSQEGALDEQKIHEDVAKLTVSILNEEIAKRDPTRKP